MQEMVRLTFRVFLGILIATSLLALAGVAYVWFVSSDKRDLPHLRWLLGMVVSEVVAIVVLLARRGLKYLPETLTNRDEAATLDFMERFVSTGTSVVIVSNRASYFGRSERLIQAITAKAERGAHFEVITPRSISSGISQELNHPNISFLVTGEANPPDARFTLVNSDHRGAEKLAIARGVHPDHEITIFDNESGPQIIALARDVVRKSRALAAIGAPPIEEPATRAASPSRRTRPRRTREQPGGD